MSNESIPFYSETFGKHITIVYGYLPSESWIDKGKYCQIPEYFEILAILDSKTNSEILIDDEDAYILDDIEREYKQHCELIKGEY